MVKLSKYIIALLVLLTSGCGHFAATRGFPVPSIDVETRLAQMDVYRGDTLITQYNDPVNANKRQRIRNDLINGRIALIDIHFNEFLQNLHEEGVGLNVFADAIAIGLGAAGALASGGTSQILSGATAAVIGTKESVDKNAFFDQTMPALITKMIAQRKTVLVGLRKGLLKSDAEYPLPQGLAEIESYYYAGTIPGAITGVVQSAGDEAASADKELLETVSFKLDDPAASIKRVIFSDPNSQTLDPAGLNRMKACWPEAGLPPDTLVLDFVLQPAFAPERRQVAACMGL